MHALSTWCRDRAPAAFADRVRALGVAEVVLDATVAEGELEALVMALLPAGASIVALAAPCPRPPGSKRPPRLASPDREERLAAEQAVARTLGHAGELGARLVILELGALDLKHDEAAMLRAFARRQLDRDAVAALVTQRRALSARALDLARFGLDPILDRASAAGVTLAVATRPRWTDIPSAGELATLLDEFQGAPLAPWYDAAAAHIRRTLGFGAGRPAVELAAAAGAWLTDAAGPRGGLPWGTGDVDRTAVLAALSAPALRVIHALPPVTDGELLAALL